MTSPESQGPLLSRDQTIQYLGLHGCGDGYRILWRLGLRGELPYVQVSPRVRAWRKIDLDAYIERQTKSVAIPSVRV